MVLPTAAALKLKNIQREMVALKTNLDQLSVRFDAILVELLSEQSEPEQPLKREDGRLTDHAIELIDNMYETGESVTAVARTFDISTSAASNRRRIWQTKKASPSAS